MKTKIEIFLDSSTKNEISKLAIIIYYKKKVLNTDYIYINENNNNKAELINLINSLYALNEMPFSLLRNHPIYIYSDSRYAIDTLNQFLAYIKKMRGTGNYTKYKYNEDLLYEKNQKYYKYKKSKYKIQNVGYDPIKLKQILSHIMDYHYIEFKWVDRDNNKIADKLSKF